MSNTYTYSLSHSPISPFLLPPTPTIQVFHKQLHFNVPLITTNTLGVLVLRVSPLSMKDETLIQLKIIAACWVENLQLPKMQ